MNLEQSQLNNAPSENFIEETIEERNPYVEIGGASANLRKSDVKSTAIHNAKASL